MKFKILFFLILIIFSCNNNESLKTNNSLVYTIKEFDLDKNQMKINLEITNTSNQTLKGGKWSLHWNQIHNGIIPESLPKDVSFKYINGQAYYILDFGPNYSLKPNEKINFSFLQKGIIKRIPFRPLGAFIRNHENNDLFNLPITFNWRNAKGIENLNHKSPKEKYNSMKGLSVLYKEQLNWIIPSPKELVFKKRHSETLKELIIDYTNKIEIDTSLISMRLKNGTSMKIKFNNKKKANTYIKYDKSFDKEEYSLEVKDTLIEITASEYSGAFYALESLHQLLLISENENKGLPIISIKDSPRFKYRGFLLDVSRNFYGINKVKQVIDYMAHFKLNKLDFRLTDDEGWRLEIPGIPELTEIGGKRGFTEDETDKLIPMYGSGAFSNNSGSGYYTKNEFVEILKYAKKRNIEVIPQISFPSHARAAIKSMEARYKNYIINNDESIAKQYLLSDFDDKSEYRSAQQFNDNIICICLDSSYDFFEKIVHEVKKMYDKADVKMKIFNIAADEVPYGAWQKSPICEKFISKNKEIKNINDLYNLSLYKLNNIINRYGAKMAGWDDIILRLTEKNQSETIIKREMTKLNPRVYVWNNTWGEGREDMIYKLTNMGFEAVMSNSSAFYFDMANDFDFESKGLSWSGYVDYKDAWGTEPLNVFNNIQTLKKNKLLNTLNNETIELKDITLEELIYQEMSHKTYINKKGKINFIGIQSQLWSETIINEKIFDALFMPNLAVFSERAWAKKESYTYIKYPKKQSNEIDKNWNLFANTLAQRHLKSMKNIYGGLSFDLGKPGAIISNDSLYVRTKFPGLIIRYTTDGSIPNKKSKKYKFPIKVNVNDKILLKIFDGFGRGGNYIKL
jgi:hexosaminidase